MNSRLAASRPVSAAGALLARPAFRLACVILASFAAHAAALHAPFIFDDDICIKENASITSLARLSEVLWPPVNGSGVSGRPLVNLSLALNYAWGGLDPRGYHWVNLGLHALASALLLMVMTRLFRRVGSVGADGSDPAVWCGFAVALLWAVHPLQTESVAGVIQRTEILGGVFYLLTLGCFLRGIEAPRPGRWYAGSVLACGLGVAAKETVFTAPLLVLLVDRTLVTGSFREAWRRRAGLYLGLAVSWLVLAWILYRMGGTRGEAAGFGAGVITWWSYFLRQWEAIVTYLKLVVWPHPLVLDYGCDVIESLREVAGFGLLLFALGGATVWGVVRNRPWALAAAAFFLILGPSSSVMPLAGQTAAEHRMYLPLAAVLALGVVRIERDLGRWGRLALVGVALGFVLASAARSHAYRSPLALWRETIAERPSNVRAHFNAGHAAFDLGRLDEAAAHYEAANRIDPNYVQPRVGLGEVMSQRGDVAAAIRLYQEALALDPRLHKTHNNLALLLAPLPGREGEALAHYEAALRLSPDFVAGHANLAALLSRLPGRQEEALRHAETALRLEPGRSDLERGVVNALAALPGRSMEAVSRLEILLRRDPADVDARLQLALVLAAQPGRLTDAIVHYEEVIRRNPRHLNAHYNLALVLAGMPGRQADAIAHYEAALAIQPDHAATHNNLGQLLLGQRGREGEARDHFAAAVRFSPRIAIYRYNLGAALALWPESRDAARREFATALQLDPSFSAAADALRRLAPAP